MLPVRSLRDRTAVCVGVVFRGFARVMRGVQSVTVRHMGVVRGFFVVSVLVMFSRFAVVSSSVFVMFGGFSMMFGSFLVLHGSHPLSWSNFGLPLGSPPGL